MTFFFTFFFMKTLVCDLVNTPCLITSENQTQSEFLFGEPHFLYFIVPEENVCCASTFIIVSQLHICSSTISKLKVSLWSLRCSSYLWINWAPIKDIRKYSMRCSTSGRGLSMTLHGSLRDFSGLEPEGLQVRKCASGDAESALDAAPSVWHGHTARVTRPMTAGWHASL